MSIIIYFIVSYLWKIQVCRLQTPTDYVFFFPTCRYTFISRMIHQFKEIISLYNNPHELYQRKHFKIVYINILISLDKLVN